MPPFFFVEWLLVGGRSMAVERVLRHVSRRLYGLPCGTLERGYWAANRFKINLELMQKNTNIADAHLTAPAMTETQMHAACFEWFWNTFHDHRRMLFHCDNNSANIIEGNKKKRMGVVKGVSDFVLILDGAVVFIELKIATGRQEPEQEDFERKVTERGHNYIIIRSLTQFKSFICQVIGQ